VKLFRYVFVVGHSVIILLFIVCAVALISFAVLELWQGVNPAGSIAVPERLNAILESIGLLTIAVAALELAQTILEEEVQRQAQMSAPTRVRRFLSRFMVVVIVSLSIETLVVVFQVTHEDLAQLEHAAMIGLAAAALLAAWGLFVQLNKSAETLEPEAMEQAKREDRKVEEGGE
jgi:hypothetical protein